MITGCARARAKLVKKKKKKLRATTAEARVTGTADRVVPSARVSVANGAAFRAAQAPPSTHVQANQPASLYAISNEHRQRRSVQGPINSSRCTRNFDEPFPASSTGHQERRGTLAAHAESRMQTRPAA